MNKEGKHTNTNMKSLCTHLSTKLIPKKTEEQNDTNLTSIHYGDKSIPLFSFEGLQTDAKVVSIYDGDTCQCVFIFNGRFTRVKVRLYGIDTPEMRIAEQKEKALQAKSFLEKTLEHNGYLIFMDCMKFDKYGRLLANLYLSKEDFKQKESINDLMIKNGHAYSYFGGTKTLNF